MPLSRRATGFVASPNSGITHIRSFRGVGPIPTVDSHICHQTTAFFKVNQYKISVCITSHVVDADVVVVVVVVVVVFGHPLIVTRILVSHNTALQRSPNMVT